MTLSKNNSSALFLEAKKYSSLQNLIWSISDLFFNEQNMTMYWFCGQFCAKLRVKVKLFKKLRLEINVWAFKTKLKLWKVLGQLDTLLRVCRIWYNSRSKYTALNSNLLTTFYGNFYSFLFREIRTKENGQQINKRIVRLLRNSKTKAFQWQREVSNGKFLLFQCAWHQNIRASKKT